MTKTDAAEVLNLSPGNITKMLRQIETDVGSHDKTVPLDMVERLGRRYMAATEIAIRRGVPPLQAHFDALDAGVPYLRAGGFCRRRAEAEFFSDR